MRAIDKRTLYWLALGCVTFFVMSFSSPECSKNIDANVMVPTLETDHEVPV